MLFTFRLRNILIWQISSREKIVYLILVFSQTLIYTSIKYCDNNMYFSVANEFTFHCFSEWTEIFIFLLKKERTLFRVHIQKTQYSPTWLLKKCHSKKKKKKWKHVSIICENSIYQVGLKLTAVILNAWPS